MRSFITTSILLALLLIIIAANYSYVNGVHDTLHELTDKINSDQYVENEDIINELYEYWEKKNELLSVSVSFREIDALSNDLDSLSAANKLKNAAQVAIYKERLQNSIDAIMRLERLSVKNIL